MVGTILLSRQSSRDMEPVISDKIKLWSEVKSYRRLSH